MERVKRNQKRLWRLWQYRGLATAFCLCFFCLPGNSLKQTSKANLKKREIQVKNRTLASRKISNKNSKISKSKKKAKKSPGYKIPRIKKSSLFHKIKLRKGDIVRSVNERPVHSKKDLRQAVLKSSKKKSKFSMLVTRNKKNFLVSYKIQKSKKRKKFLISRISQIKSGRKNKIQKGRRLSKKQNRKIASLTQPKSTTKLEKQQSNKVSKIKKDPKSQQGKLKENTEQKLTREEQKTKKSLVPKKYKSHLQRAYITSLNSFIYKKPNFDAKQLYPLEVGEKILISRKIFRPPHKFGSFHKILLFKPKKIVGYISEAEVTPEFFNEEGSFTPNPKYKLAEQQMKEDKVLDLSLFEKKARRTKKKKSASKKKKKYYIGLSAGFSAVPVSQYDVLMGLRLSGYGLLISSVNMDFNLMTSPYTPLLLRFDISGSYPLIASNDYFIHLIGGMKFDVNKRIEDINKKNDFGLTGGASLSVPLTKRLLFRLDARAEYAFANQTLSPLFLSSLQVAF